MKLSTVCGMVATLLFCGIATSARAFELDVPVDCKLGTDCFIQNYVDQGKGTDYQDFRCRPLSYDGHKGTDFRIPVWLKDGKATHVLASADGVVKNVRDGVPDALLGAAGKPDITDKECGNGVLIEHKGGWKTQYCHLRKGSVAVKPGQKVKSGEVLGSIGLSGETAFPHVHLQVTDPKGNFIDPFNAQPMESGCTPVKTQLWSDKALKHISVVDTGFLAGGVASTPVALMEVLTGNYQNKTLARDTPAIVLWGLTFGLEKGDKLTMLLFDPSGKTFVEHTDEIKEFKAQYLQFIGKKHSDPKPWAVGHYEGMISVQRGKDTLINQSIGFEVK